MAEVEKCAAICEYYAARAEEMLAPEFVSKEHAITPLPGNKQFVTFNPLGTVLIIMPWNFPFWQVFRQAATALAAGNTMMLKHASNVLFLPSFCLIIRILFSSSMSHFSLTLFCRCSDVPTPSSQ